MSTYILLRRKGAGRVLAMIGVCVVMNIMVPAAMALESLRFSHHDWGVTCDNTRTCRVVGYHEEGSEEEAVSILLTRRAGAQQPVHATLQLGESTHYESGAWPDAVTTIINGKNLGTMKVSQQGKATLTPAMVDALIAALRTHSSLIWVSQGQRWRISDRGAAAVLLKMDAFQQRIGTRGALMKPGDRDESHVLPPVAAPVVHIPPLDTQHAPIDRALLTSVLQKRLSADDLCNWETVESLEIAPLSGGKVVASHICWRGAYNQGNAFWVMNDTPPFDPVLVTGDAETYDNGRLIAAHKGRGIGDCLSLNEWSWNGQRFIHTYMAGTGWCRAVVLGGPWRMPTLVSDVRRIDDE